MLRQAILTALVWLLIVVVLDLPSVMAAAGVLFAFLFAWCDEQKRLAAVEVECEDEEPFEQTPPLFYV